MNAFKAALEFLKELVAAFNDDQVPFMAAAISYFAFFSLFPLLLGLIAGAGYFLAPEQATNQVLSLIAQGFPGQEVFLRNTLEAIVSARGAIGLFALVTLLWSGKNIFFTLGVALDIIWDTTPKGGIGVALRRHLIALLFAISVGGALILVTGLYWLLFAMLTFEIPLLGIEPQQIPGILPILSNVVPLALVILSLVAMYRWLPSHRIPFGQIAVGAAVSAVLWEVLRRLFAWYLTTFGRFNEVYGPATSVVVFLFWLYLTAVIFLFGAEVAWVYQKHHQAKASSGDGI